MVVKADETVSLNKKEYERMKEVVAASRKLCIAIEGDATNLYPHVKGIVDSLYRLDNPQAHDLQSDLN